MRHCARVNTNGHVAHKRLMQRVMAPKKLHFYNSRNIKSSLFGEIGPFSVGDIWYIQYVLRTACCCFWLISCDLTKCDENVQMFGLTWRFIVAYIFYRFPRWNSKLLPTGSCLCLKLPNSVMAWVAFHGHQKQRWKVPSTLMRWISSQRGKKRHPTMDWI